MPHINKEHVELFTITMDRKEADFLKALVQNYMGDEPEPIEHYKLREAFFESLTEAGV